ncbi:MAG: hypothetical protein ACOCUH_01470 [Bacteriovoracia bacterium]
MLTCKEYVQMICWKCKTDMTVDSSKKGSWVRCKECNEISAVPIKGVAIHQKKTETISAGAVPPKKPTVVRRKAAR